MTHEPPVQTRAVRELLTGTREQLAREIVTASAPYRSPKAAEKHRQYLLTLRVDVLQERLELIVNGREKS